MNSAVYLAGVGHSIRAPSLYSTFEYGNNENFSGYDYLRYNVGLGRIPPAYAEESGGIPRLITIDNTMVGKFFGYQSTFSSFFLDPRGRFGNGLFIGSSTIDTPQGSAYNRISAYLCIQQPVVNSFVLGDTSLTQVWLPDKGVLSAAQKPASASARGQAIFTRRNRADELYEFFSNNTFIAARNNRASIILRADIGVSPDGSKVVLKKPWTACSLTEFGLLQNNAPGQAAQLGGSPMYADNVSLLPARAYLFDSHTNPRRELGFASHVMIIDNDSGASSQESKILVLANRLIYLAYSRLYQITPDDYEKAVVVKKNSDGSLFATFMAGWDTPISGWRLGIKQQGITFGANYREDPVALSILPPYRLARSGVPDSEAGVDESFPQASYFRRVVAFSFAATSAPLQEADGSACVVAAGNRPSSSDFAGTLTGLASVAGPAVDDQAMLESRQPFDFGDVVVRSTLSATLPKYSTNEHLNADFIGQEMFSINSESMVGIGNASAGLDAEDRPSRTQRPFRQASVERQYQQQTEDYDKGEFKDGEISLVELKSSAMLSAQPPLHDHDVEFPIIEPSAQASAFRFRGKQITATGVSFVPWSSNSFHSHKSLGPQQSSPPQITLPVSSSYPPISELSFGDPPGALGNVGTLFPPFSQTNNLGGPEIVEWEYAFSIPQSATSTRHYYYQTIWLLSPGQSLYSRPPLEKTYYPNQEFDEQGYMAGIVCSRFPPPTGWGSLPAGTETPGIYGFTQGQFENRNPLITNSFAGTGNGGFRSLGGQKQAGNLVNTISGSILPSLAGREFVTQPGQSQVYGMNLQAGVFHFIGEGESFEKSVNIEFKSVKQRREGDQNGYTLSFSEWSGSETHACTFNTSVVELYVKWSASLQSPGPYSISPPYPVTYDDVNIESGPSMVIPRMFVKSSLVEDVTPVLIAEVWARAVGNVEVSSEYEMPEKVGTSGTYTQGAVVLQYNQNSGGNAQVEDISAAKFGHTQIVRGDVGPNVAASGIDFRYLGAMPFNREQTQRLLDGEEVEPTYWFLDDEGSALETQPICVAWHNTTFGTYKLRFRLITE